MNCCDQVSEHTQASSRIWKTQWANWEIMCPWWSVTGVHAGSSIPSTNTKMMPSFMDSYRSRARFLHHKWYPFCWCLDNSSPGGGTDRSKVEKTPKLAQVCGCWLLVTLNIAQITPVQGKDPMSPIWGQPAWCWLTSETSTPPVPAHAFLQGSTALSCLHMTQRRDRGGSLLAILNLHPVQRAEGCWTFRYLRLPLKPSTY